MTPVEPAPAPTLDPHDLALLAGRLAAEKKARDILVLDLRRLTSVCDFFVIATADSEPQIKAVIEHIRKGLSARGERPWNTEGMEGKRWVILDYVDIVIHVFHPDTREVYVLEKLWGDAPREEVRLGTPDA